MRHLALLLIFATLASAQLQDDQHRVLPRYSAVMPVAFRGCGAPGSVPGNLSQDTYTDDCAVPPVNYICDAPAGTAAPTGPGCTQVAAYQWQAPPASSGGGSGGSSGPITGDQNLNQSTNALTTTGNSLTASQLPHFRLAVAQTKDGGRDTKVLFLGDSTTEGIGSSLGGTFVGYGSYPSRVKLSGSASPPVVNGLAIYNIVDDRWTLGSGWTFTAGFGFCQGGNNAGALNESGAAGDLTFTPGATQGTFDSFTVYYLTNPGNGSATVTATGGSATTINTSAAAGYATVTVKASGASTGNSVAVHPVSGAVFIEAIEPFLSTTPTIRKGNAGVSGATSGQCATNGSFNSLSAIKAYAPDLTVISLGINDAAVNGNDVFLGANLQAIIAAAQVSGDVILSTMPPSQDTTRITNERLYQPIYYALSQADRLPLLDVFMRFGSAYNAAFMNSDGTHPTEFGYWDWAAGFDALVNSVVWK
jgi:lysophospholipase L1-like esterase